MITPKRIYEPYDKQDGYRVLVDRLWPRGVSREKAHLDLWLRDIAPSTELRQWFGHDPSKWLEFQSKYQAELATKSEVFNRLLSIAKREKVLTLLFAARDIERNEAVVIKSLLTLNNIEL